MCASLKKGLLSLAMVLVGLVLAASADDASGYLQVTGPCRMEFPRDHGPHPGFRTEWWYYTGNLATETGRRFGFQLTFFRHQLTSFGGSASWPEPHSAWRTRQIYFAHAALSDLSAKRHFQAEQISRGVMGIAGAVQEGPEVTIFLRNWRATLLPEAHTLEAGGEDFSIQLELKPVKDPVRHGIDGYSRKGTTPERASCYYSFSRLETAGTVTVSGKEMPVRGTSWMDHEYSTAPLEPGTVGWDWFSLQLADKTEIMIYRLRQKGGGIHPASSGSYIDASGALRHLERGYFEIMVLDRWKSPKSKATYPSRWNVKIPLLGIELDLSANLPDQEMRTVQSSGVTYWEGSIGIRGLKGGAPIEGQGYVELTGYAGDFDALK
jgi:predicted secreted hydrolase